MIKQDVINRCEQRPMVDRKLFPNAIKGFYRTWFLKTKIVRSLKRLPGFLCIFVCAVCPSKYTSVGRHRRITFVTPSFPGDVVG